MCRDDWKPREPVFSQFSRIAGYADTFALPAKIFTIFEGTSEIQRMLIGRAVTRLERSVA
jgi:alkylation response protein AidB-like acyl-CoA dehydrogenase